MATVDSFRYGIGVVACNSVDYDIKGSGKVTIITLIETINY